MKKVEAESWARDNLCEREVEKLVIYLAEDSSSEEIIIKRLDPLRAKKRNKERSWAIPWFRLLKPHK